MTDFVARRHSSTLPSSSYTMGLTSSDLHEWMPDFITRRLSAGFRAFDRTTRGFLTGEAQLIGVESRTSSPVRIPRDRMTYAHPVVAGSILRAKVLASLAVSSRRLSTERMLLSR